MSTPHSPLPLRTIGGNPLGNVYDPDGRIVAECHGPGKGSANAAYIVEACNRYGLLLDALQKIAKATEYSSGVFVAIHETARAALEGVTPSLGMDSAKDKSVPSSGDSPGSEVQR